MIEAFTVDAAAGTAKVSLVRCLDIAAQLIEQLKAWLERVTQ